MNQDNFNNTTNNDEVNNIYEINDNSGVNVIFSGDDTEIQAVTSAGEFQEKKSLTAIDSSLEDFSDLIICKDGTLQYTYVDEKKGAAMWWNNSNCFYDAAHDFYTSIATSPVRPVIISIINIVLIICL